MSFFDFLPSHIITRLIDNFVDAIAKVASQALGNDAGNVIGKLHSDADFRADFEKALQRAISRFVSNYSNQKLATEISRNTEIWKSPVTQSALKELVVRPSSFLPDQRNILEKIFTDALPNYEEDDIKQAIMFLLRCLSEEIISIPKLAPLYQLQFGRASFEETKKMTLAIQNLNSDLIPIMTKILEEVANHKLLPPPTAEETRVFTELLESNQYIEAALQELSNLRLEKKQVRREISLGISASDGVEYSYQLHKLTQRIRSVKQELLKIDGKVTDDPIDEDTLSSFPIEAVNFKNKIEQDTMIQLQEVLVNYLGRLHGAVLNLEFEIEALNWKLPNMNSPYTLVVHILGAIDEWICHNVGAMPLQRDRSAEFLARGLDIKNLSERILDQIEKVKLVLKPLNYADLQRTITTDRPIGEVTILFCIVHVIHHTSWHLGELDTTLKLYHYLKTNNIKP